MARNGFAKPRLSRKQVAEFAETARLCRGDILKMTTLAGCGHPGGSMSSIDLFTVVWSLANVNARKPQDPDRDRIIVSHGHTSPGVYAILGRRPHQTLLLCPHQPQILDQDQPQTRALDLDHYLHLTLRSTRLVLSLPVVQRVV